MIAVVGTYGYKNSNISSLLQFINLNYGFFEKDNQKKVRLFDECSFFTLVSTRFSFFISMSLHSVSKIISCSSLTPKTKTHYSCLLMDSFQCIHFSLSPFTNRQNCVLLFDYYIFCFSNKQSMLPICCYLFKLFNFVLLFFYICFFLFFDSFQLGFCHFHFHIISVKQLFD